MKVPGVLRVKKDLTSPQCPQCQSQLIWEETAVMIPVTPMYHFK